MKALLEGQRDHGPEIRAMAGDPNWRLERIRNLVHLLDTAFEIPGTRWRVGLDAIIGLIPGVGDLVTTGLSVWILYEARELGVRKRTRARMVWNVVADFVVGAVPLAGDVFDAAWKANVRNLKLIDRDLARPDRATTRKSLNMGERMKPQVATAAIIAIVSAIASFASGAFWGVILAIVAVIAGALGMLIAVSPKRRGGILSIVAIVLGAIALVRAILVAVF
jgi:hypothetical protein